MIFKAENAGLALAKSSISNEEDLLDLPFIYGNYEFKWYKVKQNVISWH